MSKESINKFLKQLYEDVESGKINWKDFLNSIVENSNDFYDNLDEINSQKKIGKLVIDKSTGGQIRGKIK